MSYTSIRDNHSHGTVGDFLREQVKVDSQVSIVSAYFTIYAYHQLRDQLDQISLLSSSAPPRENHSLPASSSHDLPYEVLVDAIQFGRAHDLTAQADVLEAVVDLMVYGLYFESDVKAAGCYINDRVAEMAFLDELSITGVMKLVIELKNDGLVAFALANCRKVEVVRTILAKDK